MKRSEAGIRKSVSLSVQRFRWLLGLLKMIYIEYLSLVILVFVCSFIKLAGGKFLKVFLNLKTLYIFYLVNFQRLSKFLFSFVIFVKISELIRVKSFLSFRFIN